MADAGGLQLLPETRKRIEVRVPGQNKPVFRSAIFVLVVIGIYFGFLIYQKSLSRQIDLVKEDFLKFEKSRDKENEQKLLDFKDQLANINPLLSGHIIASEAFVRLQRLIEPTVQFQNLGLDLAKGEYLFVAAADSYATIAKQAAAFYKDGGVTNVLVNKADNLPTGRVEFTMTLNLNLAEFFQAKQQ